MEQADRNQYMAVYKQYCFISLTHRPLNEPSPVTPSDVQVKFHREDRCSNKPKC